MDKTFRLKDIIRFVDKELKPLLNKYSIFVFKGQLGAGKTTTIKALLKSCGVTAIITSPTFTYMQTYTNNNDQVFHHFDLYRIGSLQHFLELGFDEYFYKKEWCFIEWPEIIQPLLEELGVCEQVIVIDLDYGDLACNERHARIYPLVSHSKK